jgi:transposase
MFSLGSGHTYHLYSKPTDMRKSFDGLSGLVRTHLKADPFNGHVFVFMNKQRNLIKLLHWETGGFTLYYKRLEEGRFELPDTSEEDCSMSWSDLMMIVEGIQLKTIRKSPRFSPKT